MAAIIISYTGLLFNRLIRPLQPIKPVLQLIKVEFFLIFFLIIEIASFLIFTQEEIKVKTNLASWPYSNSARSEAESIISRPKTIKKEIAAWESLIEKGVKNKDVYQRLSWLYYQIYDDVSAVRFWQQALYLDPRLPVFLPAPQP